MTSKNNFDFYLDSISKKRESLKMKQNSISKNKNIEVILRTCSSVNVHGGTPRYINAPKHEIAKKCVTSLINSINNEKNHKVKVIWFDDHSTTVYIEEMFDVFKHCSHPWEYIPLEEKGFNNSALSQFKRCRDSTADIVYSVEDDYLHCPSAFPELIESYEYLKDFFNVKEICLFPYDYPDEYMFNEKTKYFRILPFLKTAKFEFF